MNELTINSLELLKLLDYKDVKSLHTAIADMFDGDIETSDVGRYVTHDGQISEYYLPELESKMFAVKHDSNCIERMNQYWIDKKPAPKVIKQSGADMMGALEIMTNDLNLSKSEKVKAYAIGMQNYPNFVKALPVYPVDDSQIDNHTGVDSDVSLGRVFDLKYYLENNYVDKSLKQINKKLIKLGLLERKYRISSTGKIKRFKVITKKGLKYGKNITSSKSKRETRPHYYYSMIDELLMLI